MTTTPKKKRKAPPHAFKPGQSGNPGGRKAYPEWWRNGGEMGLRMLFATATGVVPPLPADCPPEHREALEDQAANADEKLRFAAAQDMRDSIYGKPVQAVEVSTPEESPVLRALVALAQSKG